MTDYIPERDGGPSLVPTPTCPEFPTGESIRLAAQDKQAAAKNALLREISFALDTVLEHLNEKRWADGESIWYYDGGSKKGLFFTTDTEATATAYRVLSRKSDHVVCRGDIYLAESGVLIEDKRAVNFDQYGISDLNEILQGLKKLLE